MSRVWMFACGVIGVIGGCSRSISGDACIGIDWAHALAGSRCGPEDRTAGAMEMAPAPAAVGDCSHTTCGLNGIWLGRQVRFRTLHLTPGVPNESNLTIARFEDWRGTALTLDVAPGSDVLRGRTARGEVAEGECTPTREDNCLTGARLFVVPPEERWRYSDPPGKPPKPTAVSQPSGYLLTIEQVADTPFWTQCPHCRERTSVPLYRFTARSLRDGCQVELCKPELAADYPGGIAGTAVIFRGDAYDDATYEVRDTTGDRSDDRVNIACLGTAISKLHLFRHTAASGGDATVAQRQTLLRLLTADYCGTGHPFTVDGLPIHLGFVSPRGDAPTAASRYQIAAADTVDARWNENGAICLGSPRWLRSPLPHPSEPELREQIARACAPGHQLRDGDHLRNCDAATGAEPSGGSAASMNPGAP